MCLLVCFVQFHTDSISPQRNAVLMQIYWKKACLHIEKACMFILVDAKLMKIIVPFLNM